MNTEVVSMPPRPEPSADEYDMFESVIERLFMECARPKDLNAARPIMKNNDFTDVAEELRAMGFRKFAPLNMGCHSAALETTCGQVLRISGSEDRGLVRDELPELTPNIIECDHDKQITYELLPKLTFPSNIDISSSENPSYGQLHRNLDKKYSYAEPSEMTADIGFTKSGIATVVDRESLYSEYNFEDRRPYQLNPNKDRFWITPITEDMPESRFGYLKGTGYISIYERDYPAVHDQRPRGILSDADIERLKNGELEQLRTEKPECFEGINAKNLEEFIELVKDEGWYPSQAQDMMRERGTLEKANLRFAERYPRGGMGPTTDYRGRA